MTLVALRAAPPAVSPLQAQRIVAALYGLDALPEPLAGERDANFRLRVADGLDIVLKIHAGADSAETLRMQTSLLRHIADADPSLPVPRIVPTRAGDAHATVLTEHGQTLFVRAVSFLPGTPLDDAPADTACLRRVGAFLARLDRAMQGFTPRSRGRLAWDPRHAGDLCPATDCIENPALRAAAFHALHQAPANAAGMRRQLIHNDAHGGNLLLNPATGAVAGLIDFGDAIEAPLAVELAVPAAEIASSLPADAVAACLVSGFCEVLPLDPADCDGLAAAIRLRHATNVTVHAWRRRHDPAGAAKLDTCASRSAAHLLALQNDGVAQLASRLRAAAAAPDPGIHPQRIARRQLRLGKGLELSYDKPIHIVRGEGVRLYDADGHAYLDAYNNVASVGHGRAELADAISRQMRRVCANTRYLDDIVLSYAERLTATLPDELSTCLFVNSGSEANDAAWRLAKTVTFHAGAITTAHAYHGISDAVAAFSPYYGERAAPRAPWLRTIRVTEPGKILDPDTALAALDASIAELRQLGFGVAAFIVDSALVSDGIASPPPGFIAAVASRVRAAGGLIIADEVQSGFGRLGDSFWGFARHGLSPDIVTLGKPMANGHPVGAVVTRQDLHDHFLRRVEFFSTFGGNPVSAAAADTTLSIIQRERLQDNARETGAHFRAGIHTVLRDCQIPAQLRGSGLMIGVELASADIARRVVNAMRELRVLIGREGPMGNVLKIRPPLPFSAADADEACAALGKALLG